MKTTRNSSLGTYKLAKKFLPLHLLLIWVSNQEENSQPEYRVPRSCVTSTKLQLHKPCQVGAGRMTSSAKPRSEPTGTLPLEVTPMRAASKVSALSFTITTRCLHSLTHPSPFIPSSHPRPSDLVWNPATGTFDVAGASSNRSNGGGQMDVMVGVAKEGHFAGMDKPGNRT